MDPDPELGKFKTGSGSGINHSGSTTQEVRILEEFKKSGRWKTFTGQAP